MHLPKITVLDAVRAVTTGIACFSIVLCFRYGFETYKSTSMTGAFHDGWFYGGLSVLFDLFKIGIIWVAARVILAKGNPWFRAGVATALVALWAATTFFTFGSAIGSAFLGRTETLGARQAQIEDRASLEARKARLAAMPDPWKPTIQQWKGLPSDSIQSEINAAEKTRLWSSSNRCELTDIQLERSIYASEREFCRTHELMKSALGAALSVERIDRQIQEIDEKLKIATSATVADPQAKMFSAMFSVGEDQARQGWSLYFALLLEAISNPGPALLLLAKGILQPELPPVPAPAPKRASPARKPRSKGTELGHLTEAEADKAAQIEASAASKHKAATDSTVQALLANAAEPGSPAEIIDAAILGLGRGEFGFKAILTAAQDAGRLCEVEIHKNSVTTRLKQRDIQKVPGSRPVKYRLNGATGAAVSKKTKEAA